MAKVLVLVMNSIQNDSRVKRESLAIASDGHEVFIVGMKTSAHVEVNELDNIHLLFFDWYLINKTFLYSIVILPVFSCVYLLYCVFLNQSLNSIIFSIAITALSSIPLIANRFIPNVWYRITRRLFPCLQEKLYMIFCIYKSKLISPEIVHAHDLNTLKSAVAIKSKLGNKLIWDAHELYTDTQGLSDRIRKKYLNKLSRYLPKVDLIFTVNEFIAKHYQEQFSLRTLPTVIYNANDDSEQKEISSGKGLRKDLKISNEKKILLYMGGLSNNRGLERLVESAQYFPKHWILVVLGNGSLLEKLKGIAAISNTKEERVIFAPYVEQERILQYINGADCGIIPYENTCLNHYYSSPNKLWEFASAGIPIIAPEYPFFKKIIGNYSLGWLIPEIESKSLVTVLGSIKDSDLEKASYNQKHFLEHFGWKRSKNLIVENYNRLIINSNSKLRSPINSNPREL